MHESGGLDVVQMVGFFMSSWALEFSQWPGKSSLPSPNTVDVLIPIDRPRKNCSDKVIVMDRMARKSS